MAQRNSPSDAQTGVTPALPAWMRRTTSYAPGRRARMLEHMSRARSLPQPQAVTAAVPSRMGGMLDILGDAFGYTVLFGIIALLFQSRIPLYLGAFVFLTDGERIERALATLSIRLEPDTIGPDIVKGFVSLFGWFFALLASLKGSVPAWLAPWLPPAESWSFIAGIAVVLAIVEAVATLAMRRALPWLGLTIRPDSLTWATIKLVMALGALALLVLLLG